MEQRLAAQNAGQGEMEDDTMVKDGRDILELLKEELDFIEKGGYGRSVRTPWQPKRIDGSRSRERSRYVQETDRRSAVS